MAIVWGSWDGPVTNRFRVGIDMSSSGRTLTVSYYVECTAAVADNQTLTRTGNNISGAVNFRMEKGSSGGRHLVGTWSLSNRNYGQNYGFGARLSGVYNGASPSVSTAYRMPPPPVTAPGAPGRPSVSSITSSSAVATFSAAATNGGSIIEYQLQWARNSSFTTGAAYSRNSTSRTRTMSPLNRATTHYCRVRARNSAGWGPWSSTRSFTTLADPPGAPGRPTLDNITSSSIRQTSTAAAANGSSIIEYQHQRSTSSTFASGNQTLTSTSRQLNRTGLSRYTLYYFRARARNARGWGPWSSSRSGRTLAERPVTGPVPNASRITRNSAYFTGWTAADNGGQSPSNLRLQYNTSQSTSGATVVTRGSWNALTLTGLQANTRYYYRGAIYNSAGWSTYSAWKSFTTLDDAPDDMGSPSFSNVTDTSFTATWSEPDMHGATFSNYEYEVALNDSFSPVLRRATRSVPNTTQTNLTPGTRYYIRMRAVASPNSGGWGEGSRMTTGFAPESGLRAYAFINGARRQGELYTFVDGELRRIRPMYAHDGKVETE